MNLYQQFLTDKELEKNGVWMNISPETKFLIARSGGENRRYSEMVALRLKPFRRQIELDTFDSNQMKKIQKECFVDACLKNWEGVTDEEGKALEFSRENALKLFTDLPDLFDSLFTSAGELSYYRKVMAKELGNSSLNTASV